MRFAVQRAVAIALPIFILPIAAQAAPKVGIVTSSNNAVVARDGKVVPTVPNMSLLQGDKLMTRANGSANVTFGNSSMRLGSSSMLPMNGNPSVLSMNSGPSFGGGAFGGGDRLRQEFLRKLAEFRRFVRDFRCHQGGFPHLQQAGFGFGGDFDDDDDDQGGNGNGNGNGNGHGHGHGHGHDHDHGNPHCPPVSP
jgi:hypothetical protein